MESITWLVNKNRLSPVEKAPVRFVAKDRRVVCDHVGLHIVCLVVTITLFGQHVTTIFFAVITWSLPLTASISQEGTIKKYKAVDCWFYLVTTFPLTHFPISTNAKFRGSILRMGLSYQNVENVPDCSEWIVMNKKSLNICWKYYVQRYTMCNVLN